jgi:non-canonical (house-cleaning) NTP pyrophosphatase
MLIAIWTLRKPKLEAVEQVFQTCPYFWWQLIKYKSQKTSSDVSDMPLSIDETMLWAKNRVKNLKKEITNADFYIWLEWWTSKIWNRYFLFSTSYIENQSWKWYYGFSPMIEIPKNIQHELYNNKKKLWIIIEELSEKNNIRSNNWTIWELSDNMIKRVDSFKLSTQAAISPFFNKYWK